MSYEVVFFAEQGDSCRNRHFKRVIRVYKQSVIGIAIVTGNPMYRGSEMFRHHVGPVMERGRSRRERWSAGDIGSNLRHLERCLWAFGEGLWETGFHGSVGK